jgi:hypothetical protein
MEQQKDFMDDAIPTGAHILKHIDELNQKIACYQYTLEWIFLSLLNKKVEKVIKKDVYFEDEIYHMLEELFEELENAKKE